MKKFLIAIPLFLSLACGAGRFGHAKNLEREHQDFFILIEKIAALTALDDASVKTLGMKLIEIPDGNTNFTSFTSPDFSISPLLQFKNIEMRVPFDREGKSSLLIMPVIAPCIHYKEIAARYPDLQIFQVKRGRSSVEHMSYAVDRTGASVRFGFKDSQSCLSRLVIEK